MTIILDSGNFAVVDQRFGSPLTVALQDKCYQSIDIITSGDYKFDFQMQDNDGISFVGYLTKYLMDAPDENGDEFEKLHSFSVTVFGKITIDLHKVQFANYGAKKKIITCWQLVFKVLRRHRIARKGTKALFSNITKQKDWNKSEFDDNVKHTLFKNTIKLL